MSKYVYGFTHVVTHLTLSMDIGKESIEQLPQSDPKAI